METKMDKQDLDALLVYTIVDNEYELSDSDENNSFEVCDANYLEEDLDDEATTKSLYGETVVKVQRSSSTPLADDAIIEKDFRVLKKFDDRVENQSTKKNCSDEEAWEEVWGFARTCFADLSKNNRLLSLMAILQMLKHFREERPKAPMKYTRDKFLQKYNDFKERDENEKVKLLNTANWMHILFCEEKGIIKDAKGKKGLAINAVSKVLEGNSACYVTGTGQTTRTADRVKIYEVEGNTEAKLRGKRTIESCDENKNDKKSTNTDGNSYSNKKLRTGSDEAERNIVTPPYCDGHAPSYHI